MIRPFSYFRDSIDEVLDPDAHLGQAGLLNQRIQIVQYLAEKWLAMRLAKADARLCSGAVSKG